MQEKMKKGEKKMILILVAILLVVVVVVVIRNKNKEQQPQPNGGQQIASSNQTIPTPTPTPVQEENVQVLEDGTKLNTSNKLGETKTLGSLTFSNIQLTNKNGQSVLLADVRNTSSSATDMQLVDIVILDKDGKELGKVGGIVSPLQPNGTTQFNTSMMIDYSNAYDFKVVAK